MLFHTGAWKYIKKELMIDKYQMLWDVMATRLLCKGQRGKQKSFIFLLKLYLS